MNKRLLQGVIFGVLLCSLSYGNDHTSIDAADLKNPHHLFLGPLVFCFDLNTNIKNIKVDGDKWFFGFKLGYEYLKPKAFYAGIDLVSAGSPSGFDLFYKDRRITFGGGRTGFGNFDIRLGYTAAPESWLISPFLGVGAYSLGLGGGSGFQEDFVYCSGGIRLRCAMTQNLDLGLNGKLFHTVQTTQKVKIGCENRSIHGNMWGGEVSMPFAWHLGKTRRWDIQLEPYFLKFAFSQIQNIYGLQLLFGYRF